MRKIVGLVGLVAILFIATAWAGVVSATTTNIIWDGSGVVNVNWNSDDDATMNFYTSGNIIQGSLIAEDKNDNPYNYGVDTSDVKVDAKVYYGGEIEYQYTRTDSYRPMYGDAGQRVYTYIGTDDEATFKWHSWSNFAQYRSSNYGWQSDNQFTAKGNHYINHIFTINDREGAGIEILANGQTFLTIMSEDHWGSSFKFGKGCGCYTNAKVDITGSGYFNLQARADNHLQTDTGISMDGQSYYQVYAVFTSGFHFGNFALEGN